MYTFKAIPLKTELSLYFLSHSVCSLMKAFSAFPEGNLKMFFLQSTASPYALSIKPVNVGSSLLIWA